MDLRRFSYIVMFGALAFVFYAAHDTRTRKENGEDIRVGLGVLSSKPQAAPRNWSPNDTMTGNILAANFAQSQRDWTRANLYLDKLDGPVSGDAATTLRMMLLAVSAGRFDRAVEFAQRIKSMQPATVATPKSDDGSSTDMTGTDGHDLASLVMMAQAIRAGDVQTAETQLNSVQSTVLKAFVQPVMSVWLKAAQKKPIEGHANGLSLLQALHHGLAAEWSGQTDSANRIFDSMSRMSLAPTGYMMVAAYDIRNGRAEAARAALDSALKLNPMDMDAKKMLDALAQGRSPELRPEFSYHLKGVTAGAAMAFRDLAQMMMADQAIDSALVFAQLGRLVRPDVPGLSILVGNIFMDQKRYEEAASALLSVQAGDIDYADAQIRLSELRVETNDRQGAISVLETLMQTNPSPRVAYALGEVYRAEDDNKKAVAAYDQAVAAAGTTPDDELWSVYFVRAMALDELGDWDKAESDLKKALTFRPDNPHILNYLGYSWADRGVNLVEAREMLFKALTLAPTDPYITDSLGWVYFKQGDLAQATLLLERAVSLKPYDPVLNDHLGDVYDKAGRTLEARYQWRRALDYADPAKDKKLIDTITTKLAGKQPQEK